MSDLNFVPALNGEEIIQDVCAALAEKLRTDCNLRPLDGYSGGYKATIKIHIETFGLDTATVDYEVAVNETTPDPQNPLQEPDDVIDADLEIPVETDLSLVRERSLQPTPDFEMKPAVEMTEEGPVGIPKPRKYTRRLKELAKVAQGGATGALEE